MKRKITFTTINQSIYLTIEFFIKNRLGIYASTCALGFLFSIVPVLMLIVIVLVKLLHGTPDIIFTLFNLDAVFVDSDKIKNLVEFVINSKNSLFLTIITVVSIFWMSRRLFNSVVYSIKSIFHSPVIKLADKKHGPVLESVFTMLGEIVLVILIALVLAISKSLSSILSSQQILQKIVIPYFPKIIEVFVSKFFSTIVNLLPFIFMFFVSVFAIRIASGTKPSWKSCIFSSLLAHLAFWGVTVFFKLFLNIARYNLVYGVLSNLIIMLFEVYIYFILFFFANQLVFTIQFFDKLLLSELFLLPESDNYSFMSTFKRLLFITPDKLLSNEEMEKKVEMREIIYKEKDETDGIYYLAQGTVKVYKENYEIFLNRGSFFGEFDCILEQNRGMTAVALVDSRLVFIPKEEFSLLVESNPDVAHKIIDMLPSYIFKIYGRK